MQIPFSVFDKKGSLLLNLKKEDFRIFEDGIEQKIEYFSAPTNLPLRFGILIDTSSSARARLKFEKEAAMQLGYYVLTHSRDHQGFLMTFDHGPEVLQDYTTNPDELTYNNPVLIADRDGMVHMLFCLEYMRCFYQFSADDGVTWGTPVEITGTFEAFRPRYDWKVIATGGNSKPRKSLNCCAVFMRKPPVWLS